MRKISRKWEARLTKSSIGWILRYHRGEVVDVVNAEVDERLSEG
jgi:hypothetical protein